MTVVDAEYREMPGTALAVPVDAPKSFLDTLRPRDRIALATEIADAIKDVIVQRGWLKRIGESDHVYIEGWQFVASLAGASCKVVSSEPLADGKGWQAHAVVVRIDSGVEIGAGSGMCSRDERTWSKREDYALRAMAETRSMSRALRGVFSFIVELAGYRATPAEEMPDHDTAPLQGGRRSQSTEPQAATVEQHQELQALAKSLGFKIVPWVTANVVPGFDKRPQPVLNVAEYVLVKERLETLVPAPEAAPRPQPAGPPVKPPKPPKPPAAPPAGPDADARLTPRTQGRLLALLDERLSTEKEARLIFAHEHGVEVDSFSRLTEEQGRKLIRALEMTPPPAAGTDPDDALTDYAEGKLFS